jgi:hypothetical protein
MLYLKDPDATLDYKFDFAPLENGQDADSNWLDRNSSPVEQISSYVITVESGITVVKDALSDSNTSVTVWLSGGTVGSIYNVACKITTASSPQRIDERTIRIKIVQR